MRGAGNHLRCVAFLNGKILTIDAENSTKEGVLVFGDRIIATGSTEEIKALLPKGGATVDLGGRTIIPGFVDSHVHMELTVNSLVNAVDVHLPEMSSLTEILNRIKERAEKTPKGEWIVARSSNRLAQKIAEKRLPTRAELDAVAPDHPVFIDQEVHILVLNSLAIEKLGWTQETWIPRNGTMGRDFQTGEPTGVFGEVWQKLPYNPWGYDNLLESLRTGTVKHYVARGVTSAHELPFSIDGIRCWQQLRAEGDLPLRLKFYFEYPNLIDIDQLINLGLMKGFGDEWLSIGGMKLFIDGCGVHGNLHPLADVKWTQEELNDVVYRAHAAGLHIWGHTVTPAGIQMGINAYRYALTRLPRKDHRLRLEHSGDRLFTYDNPDAVLNQIKELEVVPIITPQFFYTLFERSGPPLRRLLDEGFIFPGNSDTTGSEPEACDPWHSIGLCVTRKNYYGEVHTPEERITPLEAIRMFTLWGAWGAFEEKSKGSIEPGKLADMVVLGEDPLTIDPDALRSMPVELVVVGGSEKHASPAFKGALES